MLYRYVPTIPPAHDFESMFLFWVGLFLFLVLGSACWDGVRSGLLLGLYNRPFHHVNTPDGLSFRSDGCGGLVISIPKSRISFSFLVCSYVLCWLLTLWLWAILQGKMAFSWTFFAALLISYPMWLIRYRSMPRMRIWVDCEDVQVVTAMGNETRNTTPWLSKGIKLPINSLAEVVCANGILAVGNNGVIMPSRVIKGGNLPHGTIPWLASLLRLLYSRHCNLSSVSNQQADSVDDNSCSILKKYGFSDTKDLFSKILALGY